VNVEIELNGRRRAVDVRRDGGRWIVTIDGRAHRADVSEIDGRWSLLLGPPDGGAGVEASDGPWRSHEVSFEADGAESVVRVDGKPVRLTVIDARAGGWRRAHETAAGADGPRAIVAPMPGRIVKVLVRRGDAVAARQGVIVVEAMKMENELRAPRAGIVADVRVSEGMSVEANAVLVTLE
jgi:biotin carboxyl carrier protein